MDENNSLRIESLELKIEYLWNPFLYKGGHLTFNDCKNVILRQEDCSYWGAAVYKWEGQITIGDHAGELGVLIGETLDLRQRIKQYISGTQESGNKYWREEFLSKGNIYFFILTLMGGYVLSKSEKLVSIGKDSFKSKSRRLIIEKSLILKELSENKDRKWVVNREQ